MRIISPITNSKGSLVVQVLIFCGALVAIGSGAAMLAVQQDKSTLKIRRKIEAEEIRKLVQLSLKNMAICNSLVAEKSATSETLLNDIPRDKTNMLLSKNSNIALSKLNLWTGEIRLQPIPNPAIDFSTGSHFGKANLIIELKVPESERPIRGITSSIYFRSVDGLMKDCTTQLWETKTGTADGFSHRCTDTNDVLVDSRGYCECAGVKYNPVIFIQTITELGGFGITNFGTGGTGVPVRAQIFCPSACTGIATNKIVLNVACKGRGDFL